MTDEDILEEAAIAAEEEEEEEEEIIEEEIISFPGMTGLLFGKYDPAEVNINDPGLQRYINLDATHLPMTGGRHANRWFGKSHLNIVERLINNMMRTSVYTGKKSKAYGLVQDAFEIIHNRTKQNPIQILVDAVVNSAPMDEVTRLRFGGINVPKAVDTSPSRRLDLALRNLCIGAIKGSQKSVQAASQSLAKELMLAGNGDMGSFAVAKKEEVERVARSAR